MVLKTLLMLLCSLVLSAQQAPSLDPLNGIALAFRDGAVVVEAPARVHLKAAFMEVKLAAGTPGRIQVGPLPATNAKDELGEGIWRGPVVIPVKGEGLAGPVDLVVTYQPCTEGDGGVCYPPVDRTLRVDAAELMAQSPAAPARRLFWAFLVVFGAGILASLTPCVYPMIPITMAIVGANGGGRGKGFLLSLMLVLGMAVTYSALGVIAASLGQAFGAFAQHPAFLIPVSLLFGLFALSLFGAFEIRLPSALQSRLQGGGARKGFLGAFVMGLVLGPLSAPCVGPVIGSTLLAIASEGRLLLGGLQLFTFALGMGLLFLVVGTFSAGLPRSGEWLVRVKQAMGVVVLGFAVWNLRFIVPQWLNHALWSSVLLVAGVVLGAFWPAGGLLAGLRKGAALLVLGLALVLGLRAVDAALDLNLLPGGAMREEPWKRLWLEQDFEGALAKAKADGKPLVVDVYAEWCAECKELDEKTWPDPGVSAWIARNAVAVRIDTYKVRKDLAETLQISGYPTVLVVDGEGKVLRRQLGFQKPAGMLTFLTGQ